MSTHRQDVIEEIAAERERQVLVEGWDAAHDDAHTDGSLADVAAVYASSDPDAKDFVVRALWPSSWDRKWFKPKDRRHDLVRAGALILAEIERLDRAAVATKKEDVGR